MLVLSKNINTLPKLFKSFTSQKRSTKIKQTMEKIYILLPELPTIEENIIIKPTKLEQKNKYENKKQVLIKV